MARKPAAKLTVISEPPARSGTPPPASLGPTGRNLWNDITAAYEFADRASFETLFQACAAADRAAELAEQIGCDGVMLKVRGGGLRDNPLLKHELAARAFVVRALARLGLDLEPVRAERGRPAHGLGITLPALRGG